MHTNTTCILYINMSLFELGCSTWELIISRKIHNIVINKIIHFNYFVRKQGHSM